MRFIKVLFIISAFALQLQAQKSENLSNERLVYLPEIKTAEEATFYLLAQFPGFDVITVSERFHYYLIRSEDPQSMFQSLASSSSQQIKTFPNYQMNQRASSSTPNDPLIGDQYYLETIKAFEAWDITTGGKTKDGYPVTLAVFEGGFLFSNPDIDTNSLYVNTLEIPDNGIDDDNNGFLDDYRGFNLTRNGDDHNSNFNNGDDIRHGNSVLGIIAADTDNSRLVSGLIWDPSILAVSGQRQSTAEWIQGLDYIYTQRKLFNDTNGDEGAFVVAWNMSWGNNDVYTTGDYPEFCNLFDSLGTIGVLSIGAATNSNLKLDDTLSNGIPKYYDIPSNCPSDYLIMTTSSDANDEKDKGGYGPKYVDIFAPGKNILSLIETETKLRSGNSFATPQVTAAIGLMYSVPVAGVVNRSISRPAETAMDIKNMLLDEVDIVPSLQNYVSSDGRLNVFKAVSKADNYFLSVDTKLIQSKEDIFTLVSSQNRLDIILNQIGNSAWQVQVVDPIGRILRRQESTGETIRISTDGMNSGIYFVQVIQNGQFTTKKVYIH